MEVTRKNFKESLSMIRSSINKADFLVIDAEFTGLINGKDVCMFDSPAEYYTTLMNGSADFMLIQFGLCAFYWDEELKHYMNEAYNFYLFPRGRPGPEKIFLCQSSSLDFLAAQGFDFNKLIREGISYMTEPIETKLREALTEKHKSAAPPKDSITIPDEHKTYIKNVCSQVRTFIEENKSNEMEVNRCNAFVRRLLYQELNAQFKDKVLLDTVIKADKERVLRVIRLTDVVTETSRNQQKIVKEWEDLEEAVGFSKVARMIHESEKLVIGHNMLLDLLHTLNHFFQPLKSMDYPTFKEFAHCMFPKILDTKYMSSLPPFKDNVNSSVLNHLHMTLSEPPFTMPHVESVEGRGYWQADEKHHEAGYDAYITGMCFLAMHLHVRQNERVQENLAGLMPYLNKVYLSKTAHFDSPYINLAGADPSPSRDHVFHLTFPKEWQRNSITELFKPFGSITVQFLDDTSAAVMLAQREHARAALRACAADARVAVLPYDEYKRRANMTQTACQQQLEKLKQILLQPKGLVVVGAGSPNSTLKPKQGAANALKPPPSPDKGVRVRSNSLSSARSDSTISPPAPTRKRTSSGVFQIDEAEPPVKKDKELEVLQNKTNENSDKIKIGKGKDKIEKIKGKRRNNEVIRPKNDGDAKTTRVTAFKESDSWD